MTIKNNETNNNQELKKTCCEECKKICICECDKLSYNKNNCCYLQPKDICIAQVNDLDFFQIITDNQNLYLTANPLEINTSSYKIESSAINRPNDTLVINESGVYQIYVSLKYRFNFNEKAKKGDIFKVDFDISENDKQIFNIYNTVVVPNNIEQEIVNTIQGSKLQVVEENTSCKINILLKDFVFDLTYLNQIIISDLILIVEKKI